MKIIIHWKPQVDNAKEKAEETFLKFLKEKCEEELAEYSLEVIEEEGDEQSG